MMACIPPTLEGWVYIIPIHGPLDGPLYTWAQYTPTDNTIFSRKKDGNTEHCKHGTKINKYKRPKISQLTIHKACITKIA